MRMPVTGPMPHTPLWYSQRRFNPNAERPIVFGASIAAAVCGMSEYKTPLYVYRECMGLIHEEEEDKVKARRKRVGLAIEPIIIQEYEIETGNQVDYPLPCYFHPDYSFLGATPDGMVLGSGGEWDHPLDSKDSGVNMASHYGEEGTDDLPVDYLMQAQQQMLVMDADIQETVVMIDRALKIFRIERNEDLQACIIECAGELAQRMACGSPPDPQWEHPSTPKLIKEIYGTIENETVEIPEEIAIYWMRKKELASQITHLEKEKDEMQARVQFFMQYASKGILPGREKQITRSIVPVKGGFREPYSYLKLTESKIKKEK